MGEGGWLWWAWWLGRSRIVVRLERFIQCRKGSLLKQRGAVVFGVFRVVQSSPLNPRPCPSPYGSTVPVSTTAPPPRSHSRLVRSGLAAGGWGGAQHV